MRWELSEIGLPIGSPAVVLPEAGSHTSVWLSISDGGQMRVLLYSLTMPSAPRTFSAMCPSLTIQPSQPMPSPTPSSIQHLFYEITKTQVNAYLPLHMASYMEIVFLLIFVIGHINSVLGVYHSLHDKLREEGKEVEGYFLWSPNKHQFTFIRKHWSVQQWSSHFTDESKRNPEAKSLTKKQWSPKCNPGLSSSHSLKWW